MKTTTGKTLMIMAGLMAAAMAVSLLAGCADRGAGSPAPESLTSLSQEQLTDGDAPREFADRSAIG